MHKKKASVFGLESQFRLGNSLAPRGNPEKFGGIASFCEEPPLEHRQEVGTDQLRQGQVSAFSRLKDLSYRRSHRDRPAHEILRLSKLSRQGNIE